MKKNRRWLVFLLLFFQLSVYCQEEEPADQSGIDQAEWMAEKDVDNELTSLDLLDFREFKKNRVQINSANAAALAALGMLTPLQIVELLQYREELGPLISPYELQAIPGWDIQLIRKIVAFMDFANEKFPGFTPGESLRKGDQLLIIRSSLKVPSMRDTSHAGNNLRITAMYRYNFRNRVQYGFLLDKDAGESFTGRKFLPADFRSFYFSIKDPAPLIDLITIGDYTINMGQGLIQWQSFGFSKGSEIAGIKRQGAMVRPYRSSGEFNFYRGIAISLKKKNWKSGVFFSSRKLDANREADTIRSWLLSGLHRTDGEIQDRQSASMHSAGFRMSNETAQRHIALNGVAYMFSHYFLKRELPYNHYAIEGKGWYNLSADYSLTMKNIHLFGEMAIDPQADPAFLQGVLASLHRNLDVALVFRKISPGFQSMFSRAFTENTAVNNETGLYMAFTLKSGRWALDVFGDLFKFPWLKYRVDAPSEGMDLGVKLSWNPSRSIRYYTRLRWEQKEMNADVEISTHPLETISRFNIRSHISYTVNQQLELRARMETNRVMRSGHSSGGFLGFIELHARPEAVPFSASGRLQIFESANFETRLYAFENDLPYSYSVPFFSGSGWRYYLNLHWKPPFRRKEHSEKTFFISRSLKSFRLSLKWSQTVVSKRTTTIRGDMSTAETPSEVKLQLMAEL